MSYKDFDVLRAADVAIANQEGTFFDLKTFHGYGPGSPYILLGQPELAKDLRAIGLSMVIPVIHSRPLNGRPEVRGGDRLS